MSKSLRGRCLIAAKSLRDPNFYKTVVLMLEHSEEGATGLVLNRPSTVRVCHALSGHFKNLRESVDLIFIGGPVEPTALVMLHDSNELGETESSPAPNVFIGGSAESFEQVLRPNGDESETTRFRVFSGYAGWGAGQLEGEIERGDWLIQDCSHALVFATDPYEVYDVALEQILRADPLMPYRVKDASLN
jgi:putative transcriptional regulator